MGVVGAEKHRGWRCGKALSDDCDEFTVECIGEVFCARLTISKAFQFVYLFSGLGLVLGYPICMKTSEENQGRHMET